MTFVREYSQINNNRLLNLKIEVGKKDGPLKILQNFKFTLYKIQD